MVIRRSLDDVKIRGWKKHTPGKEKELTNEQATKIGKGKQKHREVDGSKMMFLFQGVIFSGYMLILG